MSEPSGAAGRVGTVIKRKWQVDARIGAGGMATVYAATHRGNGGRVALKLLHPHLSRDHDIRTRFLREAYVANAINHPNICRVVDDDVTEDGAAFLVLELLDGDTVEALRLARGGTMTVEEALTLADAALDALAAAHEKGIVHRDVKPDNVFITRDGRVKLLDFGLARVKDSTAEATKTGVTIGTPEFMPPEQALGRRDDVDARRDVWGVGATLFTAISGHYVHDASTLREQLLASATKRARTLGSMAPRVDREVGYVIDRALKLEPEDRWQSARDMQRALRDASARQQRDAPSRSDTSRSASSGPPPSSYEIDEHTVAMVGVPSSRPPTLSTVPRISRGFGLASVEPMAETLVASIASSRALATPDDGTERIANARLAGARARPFMAGTASQSASLDLLLGESGRPPSVQPFGGQSMPLGSSPASPPVPSVRVWIATVLAMIFLSAAMSAYLLWRDGRL